MSGRSGTSDVNLRVWSFADLDRRARRTNEEAQAACDAAVDAALHLVREQYALLTRLGLPPVAFDPVLFDTLRYVELDGDCWRWTGRVNNKGLPVMRRRTPETRNTEHSAVRIIHDTLRGRGPATLQPQPACALRQSCVRPEHRCSACMVGASHGDAKPVNRTARGRNPFADWQAARAASG